MTAPEFTHDPELIAQLDPCALDAMAADLGTTAERVETLLREAITAGLLSIAATETDVVLRGEFPDLARPSDHRKGTR